MGRTNLTPYTSDGGAEREQSAATETHRLVMWNSRRVMGGGMGKPSAWLNMSQRPFSYGNSERMKESSLGGNKGSWRQWSEEEDVNDSSPRSDSRAEKSLFSYPDVL